MERGTGGKSCSHDQLWCRREARSSSASVSALVFVREQQTSVCVHAEWSVFSLKRLRDRKKPDIVVSVSAADFKITRYLPKYNDTHA